MDLNRPLRVITPTVDADVLGALAQADMWFTPARLHRTIDRHSVDGVRRSLHRLARQGVVLTEHGGSAILYRLNRDHLAAKWIIGLAGLKWQFIDQLKAMLHEWNPAPAFGALFGSAASGTMTELSDIDLLLVQPNDAEDEAWLAAVSELQREAARWTGNDIRVLDMTESHLRAHAREEPVVRDVLDGGIPLIGDREWLARLSLVGQRNA